MKTIINLLVHPIVIILIIITSVLLWMPSGMGYYGWPWHNIFWRIALQIISITFVTISAIAVIRNLFYTISRPQLCFSILALIVSSYGVIALYSWKDSHLEYLESIGKDIEK